jgi:hypothetical protein
MIKLSEPKYSFEQTLDVCIDGITGNDLLRSKVESGKSNLLTAEASYLASAKLGALHTILPIKIVKKEDPIVLDDVLKSELIKIYDQYFVPEDKPARKVYDALLNAAKEKCPFCGGIGTPRNLDHFLPKAHFPLFSVLPHNLVPACRDCNMDGKAHKFACKPEDQIIQPYLDHNRFFLEQWIFATYHIGDNHQPAVFEYFVKPPDGWNKVDQRRVIKHFRDFNLAARYATKAAELLGTVLLQMKTMKEVGISNQMINTILLEPAIEASPFVNHWQKVMYQALMH